MARRSGGVREGPWCRVTLCAICEVCGAMKAERVAVSARGRAIRAAPGASHIVHAVAEADVPEDCGDSCGNLSCVVLTTLLFL